MDRGAHSGLQKKYVVGVAASAAVIAVIFAYAFQSPHRQTDNVEAADEALVERPAAADAAPATTAPAPAQSVGAAPRDAATVVTTGKPKAGVATEPLSHQCLELWGNLTAAKINGWRPDVQGLRTVAAPTECKSTNPKLAAASAAYQKACAPIFEGRFLDDRNAEDHQVIAACAKSATAMRALLGFLASAGKPLSEITDPNLLVDRLLVASGALNGETAVPRGKLALDPASLSDVSGTSLRLLQIADSDQEKNMASRFYVVAEAESAGLTPRDVFRNTVTPPAPPPAPVTGDGADGSQASQAAQTTTGSNAGAGVVTTGGATTTAATGRSTASTDGSSTGSTAGSGTTAGTTTASGTSDPAASGGSATGATGAATDPQTQIATIRGQVETYNPGFFNRPHRTH